MRTVARTAPILVLSTSLAVSLALSPAQASSRPQAPAAAPARIGLDNTKVATSRGYGGAVSSVDPYASQVGLRVLRRGGNAVDAAVAMAATLGVTEPFSAGIGGGGYFVYYDHRTGRVRTIDGRETAPETMPRLAFNDPATGEPYSFTPELVTSGVSVGTPGTLATWRTALRRWGSTSLRRALRPATRVAARGFRVDPTFRGQVEQNEERFNAFTSTRDLYYAGGDAPAVGSIFRNRDLARTYRLIGRRGAKAFYRGVLAREMARTVQAPPTTATTDLPVPAGYLTRADLRRYRALVQAPTHSRYRGYDVYGMAPSSSGGLTIGEALNILERFPLRRATAVQALHHYLEASALAFADRSAYIGDRRFVDVPVRALLSQRFGRERSCEISPTQAFAVPTEPGDPATADGSCATPSRVSHGPAPDTENTQTTNLTVVDRWHNVVEYTLTIEQTGGSGIVVPGRGFLLNNELTDFSYAATYDPTDPNRIQPGKRPRSSMSPTILLRGGRPALALGSPGGSTIITTVLQLLFNRIDRGMSLPRMIAAPRATQRNTAQVQAEPAFYARYAAPLTALGHDVVEYQDIFTGTQEIGAATAISIGRRGRLVAVSEPDRRGGGSALVVRRRR